MIIVVTGMFDEYDWQGNYKGKEFGVSHGYDPETGKNVILPCEKYPSVLGAVYDNSIGEWVIYD